MTLLPHSSGAAFWRFAGLLTGALALIALPIASSQAQSETGAGRLAFARGDNGIWISDVNGNGAKKLGVGDDPCISPDGARVAFNTLDPKGPERRIAVIDLAGDGHPRLLENIPSANCFGPVWSPDGEQLVFQIFDGVKWHLGLAGADDGSFRYLRKSDETHPACYSTCWAMDGKSVFCQDMKYIYRLGLDGTVLSAWKASDVFPGGSFTSNSRMEMSPDGSRIVAAVEMDEVVSRKGSAWPLTALWLFDFASGKAERLTPKKEEDLDPCWLSGTEILCVDTPSGSKTPNLYKIVLGAKGRKLWLKNASFPSVSRGR